MGGTTQIPSRLTREWALYAIAAAASRFIPVPFLDDAVKERATRLAVTRTLRVNGRDVPDDAVEPLYAGVESWRAGVFRSILSVPRRIVLFPVRKYVAIFGAVRGVPTDVMQVLLLGRAVHRSLAQGWLEGSDRKALRREAAAVRTAYDGAVEGMDLRVLTRALSDGLSQGRDLTGAAVAYARVILRRRDAERATPGEPVEQGARRILEVLHRPDVAAVLDEFDRRLDERLERPTRR